MWAFRSSAPHHHPAMPAQARIPKKTCYVWLWALESFGDSVGVEDKPPGHAMQILLRLMQDTGLCAEQMQGWFQQPIPHPDPHWSVSPQSATCNETRDSIITAPPDHHAGWRPRRHRCTPCVCCGARDLSRELAEQETGIPGG